jgi:hypothetical protein
MGKFHVSLYIAQFRGSGRVRRFGTLVQEIKYPVRGGGGGLDLR